ncbi:MAG: response regulator transcription factor [Chloroflexota bacterium]
MITIVVADDHQVMRQGLCTLLGAQPDFQIVGDASDGEAAIKLVERFHPDVLVLDMVMPGINGIEVARRLRTQSPACAIVILSMYGAEGYVREAVQAGAKGYVIKKDSAEELASAIREVVAGRHYISPSLTKKAVDSYVGIDGHGVEPYQTLTARERQVLHLVAAGSTTAQIAAELFISPRTVEFHRANIMRKLGIHTQLELTRYCIEAGICPPKKI